MAFQPNRLTFDDGVKMLQAAAKEAGVQEGEILTSQDISVKKATELLSISNVPGGFTKWMLPVYLDGPSQQYFSYSAPGVVVPRHSHDEGDGLRVILHGQITYKDITLRAGDWMFIPKGKPYEFSVGPQGVGMFYCYRCCCA